MPISITVVLTSHEALRLKSYGKHCCIHSQVIYTAYIFFGYLDIYLMDARHIYLLDIHSYLMDTHSYIYISWSLTAYTYISWIYIYTTYILSQTTSYIIRSWHFVNMSSTYVNDKRVIYTSYTHPWYSQVIYFMSPKLPKFHRHDKSA